MLDLDPFESLALSLHHSPGAMAVLVGSGLSRAAGISTGWEITVDLIRRLGALRGVADHDDWPQWFTDTFKKAPNYSEILDALATTPAERRAILHEYIEPRDSSDIRKPTKAHHALARLVADGAVKVVITTNFDRLIESALREAGVEPTVIASDDALVGATPLVHSRCTVVKLHGDYHDARIKNTDAELSSYSPEMNRLLDEIFDRFGLLIVGWSGEWDDALRAALMRAPSRRYPLFWAVRGTVASNAQAIVEQRGGRIVSITDADELFGRLEHTLGALRQAARPHPQSVEIAVALAKRYCRDDQFEMEWTEFLMDEVEKIRTFIKSDDYTVSDGQAPAMNVLVRKIVARSTVLRRACMVCGRWGSARAKAVTAKALATLFRQEPMGGLTILIELRVLPASLAFYWYLFGCISNDDMVAAAALLNSTLRINGRDEFVGSRLPLQVVSENGWNWKILEGYERRKTPHSDFVLDLLQKEVSDIAVSQSDVEDLFDDLEFLLSIQFTHRRIDEISKTGLWFWAPTGRYVWRNSLNGGAYARLDKVAALDTDSPILEAGLLGGTPEMAQRAADQLREFFKQNPSAFW